jgi:hypothetical protein
MTHQIAFAKPKTETKGDRDNKTLKLVLKFGNKNDLLKIDFLVA